MNHKGETSVLNTIIGALIGIAVAAITISTIFFLIKVGHPGQDSLLQLAQKAKEVSAQDPGASGLTVFFQEEDSFYYPVTKETRNKVLLDYNRQIAGEIIVTPESSLAKGQAVWVLSHTRNPDCETQNCLCLCQEFEDTVTKHCLPGKLFCEQLPDIGLSPGTEVFLTKGDDAPAQQQVKIIHCRGGESYCKNSKKGEISIIFNWLDQKGVYDAIK